MRLNIGGTSLVNQPSEFELEKQERIELISKSQELAEKSVDWILAASPFKYAYNFSWMGRPAIQFPTDAWALQELVWKIRPSVIIEAGVAHGGSVVFSASLLALLDLADAIRDNSVFVPSQSSRRVLGIDIEIRPHNRAAIESHPMASRIKLIEGSSIDPMVVEAVKSEILDEDVVMVLLDSNHTHSHVLAELEAYAGFVSEGSYCVVYDTIIEKMSKDSFPDRAWGRGNNPMTAVELFLERNQDFESDDSIPGKIQITVAPSGYLRRRYVGSDGPLV